MDASWQIIVVPAGTAVGTVKKFMRLENELKSSVTALLFILVLGGGFFLFLIMR